MTRHGTDPIRIDRTEERAARVDLVAGEHAERTELGPAPVEANARLQAGTARVAPRPSPLGGPELPNRFPHQPETSRFS